jgi:hypothetical protein
MASQMPNSQDVESMMAGVCQFAAASPIYPPHAPALGSAVQFRESEFGFTLGNCMKLLCMREEAVLRSTGGCPASYRLIQTSEGQLQGPQMTKNSNSCSAS